MTLEDIDNAATQSATKNSGILSRQSDGRWKGIKPGPSFDTPTIQRLVKAGRLTITKTTEAGKAGSGFPTEASLV